MNNIFQSMYDARLKSWYQLRLSLENKNTETMCIETDKWWQYAPLVNHYLHVDFMEDWPGPWELIAENNYCTLARALGIIYTLLLLGKTDIELVEAKDYNNEENYLVLVDNRKFILNYWPNTVIENKIEDFTVLKTIDITPIKRKIG